MLARFVRIQLIIFTVASVVGVATMAVVYMQVGTLLGVGKITVTLDLPATGGLYQFSNVTYRGVQVGRVTAVSPTAAGATATLSLDTSPRIPADLQAEVRSISAVGEQYVDLRPRNDSPPYLRDGDVIAMRNTTIPQRVGPMLDKVSALVASIPKDRLGALLDESYRGFNGAGDDFGSLIDSAGTISRDFNGAANQSRALIDDSGPLLDGQAATADAIRMWARSLAGVTQQLSDDDPQIRSLLQKGPGAAQEVSRLLDQVKPTLPVLLANLTTVGQVGVTYNASLEQLLVLLPPYVASLNTLGATNNPYGIPMGDFAITVADPPACTVGFLPPSQWRSPADQSEVDTPDGLYCKLPQDSPISVRGARNYPCIGHPGKRAPTVEICDSDKPFEPLAQRQHITGPYPIDPNLVAQGIPPDDRVNSGDRIYGPTDGTALPPGAAIVPAPATPADEPPPSPAAVVPPIQPEAPPPAASSSFDTSTPTVEPSVAIARYDPHTGKYVTTSGQVFQQTDLTESGRARTWEDMLLH